jgi:hypothetical protein
MSFLQKETICPKEIKSYPSVCFRTRAKSTTSSALPIPISLLSKVAKVRETTYKHYSNLYSDITSTNNIIKMTREILELVDDKIDTSGILLMTKINN